MFKFIPEAISWMLIAYLVFKTFDNLTGIAKTIKNKNYKSRKMRDGLIRWISELLAITFVLFLDIFLNLKYSLIGVTLALFIYKEIGSILENFNELGVSLDHIKDSIEVLNPQNKNDNKKIENETKANKNDTSNN